MTFLSYNTGIYTQAFAVLHDNDVLVTGNADSLVISSKFLFVISNHLQETLRKSLDLMPLRSINLSI